MERHDAWPLVPEHAKACQDLWDRAGGFYNEGPFTPFLFHEAGAPPKTSIQFPGNGGPNWGGTSADPTMGYVFVSTHDAAFAADWADEIHVMVQGRCLLSRPVDALLTQPQAWRDVGQSPPEVMALHAELVRQGVLPAVPVPRSIERLLAALRAPRPATASESVIHEH